MPPLKHQWSKPLGKDFIQPWIDMAIADVILTMPWEVIVLFEKKSVHRGLSYEVADELVCGLPCTALWVNTKSNFSICHMRLHSYGPQL